MSSASPVPSASPPKPAPRPRTFAPELAGPGATVLGYPRIGPRRELKRALESYWRGHLDAAGLHAVAVGLRTDAWRRLARLGLESVPVNDFSYYDQVLDTAVLLGAIPARYAAIADPLERYFAMARGDGDLAPLRDDQVVRHELPLPRPRDRAGYRVRARRDEAAGRARRRGCRARAARRDGAAGRPRPCHVPPPVEGRGRRTGGLRATRPPRRSTPSLCAAPHRAGAGRCRLGAARRAGTGDRPHRPRTRRGPPHLRDARRGREPAVTVRHDRLRQPGPGTARPRRHRRRGDRARLRHRHRRHRGRGRCGPVAGAQDDRRRRRRRPERVAHRPRRPARAAGHAARRRRPCRRRHVLLAPARAVLAGR